MEIECGINEPFCCKLPEFDSGNPKEGAQCFPALPAFWICVMQRRHNKAEQRHPRTAWTIPSKTDSCKPYAIGHDKKTGVTRERFLGSIGIPVLPDTASSP